MKTSHFPASALRRLSDNKVEWNNTSRGREEKKEINKTTIKKLETKNQRSLEKLDTKENIPKKI